MQNILVVTFACREKELHAELKVKYLQLTSFLHLNVVYFPNKKSVGGDEAFKELSRLYLLQSYYESSSNIFILAYCPTLTV